MLTTKVHLIERMSTDRTSLIGHHLLRIRLYLPTPGCVCMKQIHAEKTSTSALRPGRCYALVDGQARTRARSLELGTLFTYQLLNWGGDGSARIVECRNHVYGAHGAKYHVPILVRLHQRPRSELWTND